MILPGATLGILGGGQLGRMFLMAARTMGYQVVVFDPDPLSPAGALADLHIQASYTDTRSLDRLAEGCQVVTTEFENIPAETLNYLAEKCLVHPSGDAVRVTQNRYREKTFVREAGLKTAQFASIVTPADLEVAATSMAFPAILKVAELGYDGKGQIVVPTAAVLPAAFDALDQRPCVLEQRVSLASEISVTLARNSEGQCSYFPVAQNEHRNGILHRTLVPAQVDEAFQRDACEQAEQLAEMLDYVGVMAVEFFITREGELLVNEIAPRTHNSGHYSIDACLTSQFEQQVRAICQLAFGPTTLTSTVAMVNLLGEIWGEDQPAWEVLAAVPRIKLHLYGKAQPRSGRKMGHFCLLGERPDNVAQESEWLFQRLRP